LTSPAANLTAKGVSRDEVYRQVTRVAVWGLSINLLLGIGKLVGGLVSGSFALLADSVNSLGDTLGSIVVLYALWVAKKPADDEHPFGHSKAEAIAASNVSLLVIVSAGAIGWEALSRLATVHTAPPAWALLLAGANVLIKEALFQYTSRLSNQSGSAALAATAWDHRSDALCSLAVLIGVGVVWLGGPAYSMADDLAALFVVAVILWGGTLVFRQSAAGLMDQEAPPELGQRVREIAATIPGVQAVEKLRVRRAGLEFFAEIHVQVDPDMRVAEGHAIGHKVHDRLLEELPLMREVLVHLEPFDDGKLSP
jgi:cation diffusion facilitator family transporter